MAVCCATQLVASTVLCSSEVSALILFKLRGLWTVYWTDYGLCIGLIMDCLLEWLQQAEEGAVNNVAHKITKVLKYKIRLPQIILYNLI